MALLTFRVSDRYSTGYVVTSFLLSVFSSFSFFSFFSFFSIFSSFSSSLADVTPSSFGTTGALFFFFFGFFGGSGSLTTYDKGTFLSFVFVPVADFHISVAFFNILS